MGMNKPKVFMPISQVHVMEYFCQDTVRKV